MLQDKQAAADSDRYFYSLCIFNFQPISVNLFKIGNIIAQTFCRQLLLGKCIFGVVILCGTENA